MRSFFLLMLAGLFLCYGRPVAAQIKDQVAGSFYFYDYTLDGEPNDPTDTFGISQAKMIDCQGKSELLELGRAPHVGRSLLFTPDKVGDSISFQIHIAKVQMPTPYSIRNVDSAGSEGIYQFLVNDHVTGPDHDYEQQGAWEHGKFPVTPGDYKITYRYIGPSPKAGKPCLNLIRLEIV